MAMKVMRSGFQIDDEQNYIINRDNWGGDSMYLIHVNNGTATVSTFITSAEYEQDAVDNVVNFCEENDIAVIHDFYELKDCAESEYE